MLHHLETLYIAGGAVVYTAVAALDATNVCILGRGIIDTSEYERGKELLAQHMRLIDKMGVSHESGASPEPAANGSDHAAPVTLEQLEGEAV